MKFLDLFAYVADILNQVHVVSHCFEVCCLLNLALYFDSFLKGVNRVLQELSLVFLLLLDVLVDIFVVGLLVFHVSIQALINSSLQLLLVFNAVHNCLAIVLEFVDHTFVVADFFIAYRDGCLDFFLASAEVVDHVGQT